MFHANATEFVIPVWNLYNYNSNEMNLKDWAQLSDSNC